MDRLAEIAEYNSAFGNALTDEDFLAAGYTPEEISAYRGQFNTPGLTQQDLTEMQSLYGTLEAPEYNMRDTATQRVQDALIRKVGMDPYQAGVYARRVMGDPNAQGVLDSLGLADLTPLGAAFAIEEGSQTAVEGYERGDPLQMGLGVLEAGLGLAEAFPLTKTIARGISETAAKMDPNTLYSVFGPPSGSRAPLRAPEIGGASSVPALPDPRNEAEAMAKQVLEMRAAGRAGDVTEEMMAATDPQYMFANTPLPMDEASRMARAAGRRDEFHGTTTGSDMTYADAFRGSGSRQGIGFVTSDNPYVASSYADPQFGSVLPMLNDAPPVNAPRLDVGGEIWSQIPKDLPVQVGDRVITARDVAVGPADVGGVFDTNQLSRGASFDYPAIEFSNISDRSIHAPRPRTDDGMAVMREFQAKGAEPSTVTMRHDTRGMRSRFARFDPAFAHLRNLSAGVGGAAVLAALADDAEAGAPEMQIMGLVQQSGVDGAAEALGVSPRDIEEAIAIAVPPSQWEQIVVGPR